MCRDCVDHPALWKVVIQDPGSQKPGQVWMQKCSAVARCGDVLSVSFAGCVGGPEAVQNSKSQRPKKESCRGSNRGAYGVKKAGKIKAKQDLKASWAPRARWKQSKAERYPLCNRPAKPLERLRFDPIVLEPTLVNPRDIKQPKPSSKLGAGSKARATQYPAARMPQARMRGVPKRLRKRQCRCNVADSGSRAKKTTQMAGAMSRMQLVSSGALFCTVRPAASAISCRAMHLGTKPR